MKPDVYIIKVGSVEEKYLKKIGIKKYNLQEVRNTFSQSYYYGEIVGYRVKGLENVKDFCVKLLNYMKNKEQLTGDEIKVKNRLDKTIKAINKRAISDSNIKENR
jgi:Asp-tRNA(Asn)/Glu-tRNA(Gln) amidotransferase B subunit